MSAEYEYKHHIYRYTFITRIYIYILSLLYICMHIYIFSKEIQVWFFICFTIVSKFDTRENLIQNPNQYLTKTIKLEITNPNASEATLNNRSNVATEQKCLNLHERCRMCWIERKIIFQIFIFWVMIIFY